MSIFDSADANRVTRKGHEQACRELERTPVDKLDEGNPNHPQYELHLFGEEATKFMARQYRKAGVKP